jgi:hypothetical protein
VVLETRSGEAYVGRFDSEDVQGIHLLDVAIHSPAEGAPPLAEFVARTQRFGVRSERRHAVIPREAVGRVTRLTEWSS